MELELESKKEGKELTIILVGEVNTGTAPKLKDQIDADLADSDVVIFDFEKCDFVSSAGLRILLATYKALKAKKCRKINEIIFSFITRKKISISEV